MEVGAEGESLFGPGDTGTAPGRRRAMPAPRAFRGRSPAGHPGLAAASPADIPARGWWATLRRVAREFSEDRVLSLAAGVAFYTLLAVFPAIAAFIALYGLFFDPSQVERQIDAAVWVLPDGMIEVLREQTGRVLAQERQTLGLGFGIGLATALWSANAGTKALIEALNIAYEEEETRSFLGLTATSLVLTLGGIVIGVVALAAVVALPVALEFLHLDSGTEGMIALLRWPALALLITGLIALLYRFGPCRAPARWSWVSGGSLAAAVLWLAVSAGFSWYVGRFGSYNETYGSLGAVIGFMTWIWLSVTVVLLGAELNAELEHQTARDTTIGRPRPLGLRGAAMADRVAIGE
ncbi:YihY/virulence factor BrkB family protein [Ancylobacter lacus]|nr:YihY/virulence factor BrkB family protein [Ancylobacter lacus]